LNGLRGVPLPPPGPVTLLQEVLGHLSVTRYYGQIYQNHKQTCTDCTPGLQIQPPIVTMST